MEKYNIDKAQGPPDVKSVCIVIDRTIPDMPSIEHAASYYEEEANALFEALTTSLPGGTLDRLMVKLLEAKVSHFAIASWAIGKLTDIEK